MSNVVDLSTPLQEAIRNYEYMSVVFGNDVAERAMAMAKEFNQSHPECGLALIERDQISLYRECPDSGEYLFAFRVSVPGLEVTSYPPQQQLAQIIPFNSENRE